jgi:hypothetical protein
MTSISAATSSTLSPLQRLQDQLQAEVNAGAISSSDQSALSSALTDINASLQNGAAGDQAGGTNSPPGDLKSKINDLISNEVSSGKLTSDQASELQGVFKAAFADGGGAAGGAGHAHHGHHGGHGGASSADSSQPTDSTSSTSSTADVLQQFLQSLQNSLAASSSSASYGTTGAPDPASSAGTSFSALLINYQS